MKWREGAYVVLLAVHSFIGMVLVLLPFMFPIMNWWQIMCGIVATLIYVFFSAACGDAMFDALKREGVK